MDSVICAISLALIIVIAEVATHLKDVSNFETKGLESILIGNKPLDWSYSLSKNLERCKSWFDEFPSCKTLFVAVVG